jgi:hypothetical protein
MRRLSGESRRSGRSTASLLLVVVIVVFGKWRRRRVWQEEVGFVDGRSLPVVLSKVVSSGETREEEIATEECVAEKKQK